MEKPIAKWLFGYSFDPENDRDEREMCRCFWDYMPFFEYDDTLGRYPLVKEEMYRSGIIQKSLSQWGLGQPNIDIIVDCDRKKRHRCENLNVRMSTDYNQSQPMYGRVDHFLMNLGQFFDRPEIKEKYPEIQYIYDHDRVYFYVSLASVEPREQHEYEYSNNVPVGIRNTYNIYNWLEITDPLFQATVQRQQLLQFAQEFGFLESRKPIYLLYIDPDDS